MTRGIKVRLIAFVILSAIGIVYVAGNYLGLVDRILGRGYTVHATLPESGGLFEGSEVTYRGVKIGRVSKMEVSTDGAKLDLDLKEGTKLPTDAQMFVHNLSAVGEQYLDFEPASADGPYASEGHTFRGDASSLPVAEDDLLVDLDALVNSVDKENLGTVVAELGNLFRDTGHSMQRLLDSGTILIDEATAHTDETIALLHSARDVLATQRRNGDNIRAFSKNLNLLTQALAGSDGALRDVLTDAPPAVREVDGLLQELAPSLPVLLSNMVSATQVVVAHLPGVETLLVNFPLAIAAGFTGTPGDGWGHVNLQLDQTVMPCTGAGSGYKPASEWRSGHDLTDGPPAYPAQCLKGAPFNQRGSKYSPTAANSVTGVRRVAPASALDARVAGPAYAGTSSLRPPTGQQGTGLQWLLSAPLAGR
ncbi:MlaD family protein [Nocardioides daejeonensis]|uniref:MlaD family protein n=1 Tax=Nocardioides daejeonensis TaxID=1046556 RepID=UPI000D74446A|nr:MlaD family protein [Nocardioides daejeonensis]